VLGGVGCVDAPEIREPVYSVESGVQTIEDAGMDDIEGETSLPEDPSLQGLPDVGLQVPGPTEEPEPCDGVDNDGDGLVDESGE
jgi:hypothetical protein